ncbi:uncharacterized protein LOC144016528 [Festucalex cinctus]
MQPMCLPAHVGSERGWVGATGEPPLDTFVLAKDHVRTGSSLVHLLEALITMFAIMTPDKDLLSTAHQTVICLRPGWNVSEFQLEALEGFQRLFEQESSNQSRGSSAFCLKSADHVQDMNREVEEGEKSERGPPPPLLLREPMASRLQLKTRGLWKYITAEL